MSLTDEERTIVVGLEVEKAQVAYNDAIWLMENDIVYLALSKKFLPLTCPNWKNKSTLT